MRPLSYFVVALLMGIYAVLPAFAQQTQGIVTADTLNIRNAPSAGGTSEVLGRVSKGTAVTIVGRNADTSFYEVVTPNGLRGWASSGYIYVATPGEGRFQPVTSGQNASTPIAARGIVNTNALNVRTAPDLRADIIVTLPGGSGVDIIGRNANSSWYEVRLNDGQIGWVAALYLVERGGQGENAVRQNSDQIAGLPPAIGVIRGAVRVNVRISPDPLAAVLRIAGGGERVTLLQRNNGSTWYLVRFEDGAQGWVYSDYVSFYLGAPENAETVSVPAAAQPSTVFSNGLVNQPRLNVRSLPDPNAAIVDSIGYQTRVTVIGRNANTTWLQVDANGISGWVYAPFVTPNVGNFANAPVTAR